MYKKLQKISSRVPNNNETIFGTKGSDNINGYGGSDIIYGGAGNDVLYGENRNNTIAGGDDYLSGGAGNDRIFGNLGKDYLSGGAGNDILDGGAGSDALRGGSGRDIFIAQSAFTNGASEVVDVIQDFSIANDKIDLTDLGITSFSQLKSVMYVDHYSYYAHDHGSLKISVTLDGNTSTIDLRDTDPAQLGSRNFIFSKTGSAGKVGSDYADNIFGSAKAESLIGNAGDDFLMGEAGNDTIYGDDKASAKYGDDYLNGGAGNDKLIGGNGKDKLVGGTGNDKLTGGFGDDYLSGGAGKDVFVFNSVDDLGEYSSGTDVISDFTRGSDKISIAAIQANYHGSGSTFKWIGVIADKFELESGEVGYYFENGDTVVGIYDGSSRVVLNILDEVSLRSSDFIL